MLVRNSTARRERARERARRDILLAAGEVFSRRGYAAATLAELAEAAGYAPPSLYRYFESKEEIYRSLFELLLQEIAATFEEPADRRAPLAARLEALLRSQARVAAARRSLFGVLARATSADPGTVNGHRLGNPDAGIAFYEEGFRGWLERNVSRRELRQPPELAARAFAGIAFAFHVRTLGEDRDPAGLVPALIDLALHGFAAGADAPGPRRGATP